MNLPDRFDIYSTGLIFLQMVSNNIVGDMTNVNKPLIKCLDIHPGIPRITYWQRPHTIQPSA